MYEFDRDKFLLEQQKDLSPIEKVQLIEKTKEREGVNSYDEAIDLIEKETGTRPYQDYYSFKTVRNRFKEVL